MTDDQEKQIQEKREIINRLRSEIDFIVSLAEKEKFIAYKDDHPEVCFTISNSNISCVLKASQIKIID